MTDTPAVVLERVSKSYGDAGHAVTALSDVSLQVPASQFLSIMGPSGSGKSTLLNLIAGLDTPTHGRVIVGGQELTHLSDDACSDLRLRHIGFVFQSFNLFPTFTAEENVAWPLGFVGLRWRAAKMRAAETLEQMGVDAAARSRLPAELSGGEQQRVAIARALVTEPRLVLGRTHRQPRFANRSGDPRRPPPIEHAAGADRHHGHPQHLRGDVRAANPRAARRPHRA